jgi:F0F1-type ATP synthase membrane subunit a
VHPRTKSSLLWGAVGALVFLVLTQGYELLAAPGISLLVKLGLAVVVWVVVAVASYAFEGWLARSERS